MKVTLAIVLLFLCSVSSNRLYTIVDLDELSKVDKHCKNFKLKPYLSRFFTVEEFSLISFFKYLNKNRCYKSLKLECERKTFDFSSFTEIVYSHFCETENYKKVCTPILENLLNLNKSNNLKSNWNSTKQKYLTIAKKNRDIVDITDKCVVHVLIESEQKDFKLVEQKNFNSFCISWSVQISKYSESLHDSSVNK